MIKVAIAVGAAVLLLVSGILAVPLLFSSSSAYAAGCRTGGPTTVATVAGQGSPAAGTQWSADQVQNATTIVTTTLTAEQLTPQAAVIAVATAMQESHLINLPGGDRDSVGLFQQRPSQGWGTAAEVRDPVYATKRFDEALKRVANWQTRPLGEVAQAVQRSSDPPSGPSYAQWAAQANDLVSAIMGGQGLVCTTSAAPFASGSSGDPFGGHCQPHVAQPYGNTAYEHPHHGVDLTCPEGTPIYSVTAGRVYYATDGCGRGYWVGSLHDTCGGGYGNWVQVQVQMALPGQSQQHTLYVLYAHMLKGTVAVKQGQMVQQRQLLGEVDSSGWSSGDHLHFEVDQDRSVTTSSMDPTPFLNPSVLGGQKTCVTSCA